MFGPRSEQPDAIEAPTLMPLPAPTQDDGTMTPLLSPPSSDESEADEPAADEPPADTAPDTGSSTKLRRLPKPSDTELTGWRAKAPKTLKRTVRSTPPAEASGKSSTVRPSGNKKKRPCPHCSVTFKPRRAPAAE
ncbi:MAG TPA: hypothetical protein VJ783_06160 [Pirellulales bacterium]|nr:hypothetical protein [Pirellulales bacterium]